MVQKLIELDYGEAQAIIRVVMALDSGSLNPDMPVTTARAVAAVIHGSSPSRADVLATGDLLNRLGCFGSGRGPAPHSRSMSAVVAAVRAHEEVARAVRQLPLVLRG